MMQSKESEKMKSLIKTLNEMPWSNQTFYKNWLAQSYYYTSHSTRMCAFAAGWSDKEHQGYYRRSLAHIREEQGHDLIAMNDLKKLGGDVTKMSELETTRALWEPQFVKMQRNPMHLLGYILALEELAVKTFKNLSMKTAEVYGDEATRFIKVHADDDPDHVEEALAQIETCTAEEKAEIMKNYDQTCVMYELMLKQIQALS